MSIGALKIPAMADGRARFGPQAGDLRAERREVLHHGHAALDQREVAAPRGRLAGRADVGRNPRQPDVEQEAGGVLDQLVVFVGAA